MSLPENIRVVHRVQREFEGLGDMMVLEHGGVVVEQSQLMAAVTEESIRPARMIHVVNNGCN